MENKPINPAYRYAEALLIVFNKYTDPDAVAIEFNYQDLYELIKCEDAGTVYVSEKLVNSLNTAKNKEEYKKIYDEIQAIEAARLKRKDEVKEFMENVSDALNFSELCDKYNRELIITENEGEKWIAVDLKKIKTTKISF